MYLLVKYVHILVAILALGGSAGLGIVLEFYGDDPRHGVFVLRAIHRIETRFVMPGYVVMLATGLWLAVQSWNLSLPWIQGAIALWGLGAVLLGVYPVVLRRQIAVFEALGPASARYRRLSLLGRALGAGGGLVIPIILYLMVAKPELPFWPR
jgi:uncharacterized membrane protein